MITLERTCPARLWGTTRSPPCAPSSPANTRPEILGVRTRRILSTQKDPDIPFQDSAEYDTSPVDHQVAQHYVASTTGIVCFCLDVFMSGSLTGQWMMRCCSRGTLSSRRIRCTPRNIPPKRRRRFSVQSRCIRTWMDKGRFRSIIRW